MEKHKIVIQNAAKKDVLNAKKWYKEHGKGLSKKFAFSVEVKLDEISLNPYAYAIRYSRNRKAKISSFPYSIVFYIDSENETVFVTTIIHNSRATSYD